MKPSRSILDPAFRYVPSVSTSVADTWRRFGWRSEPPVAVKQSARRGSTDRVRGYDTNVFSRLPEAEQRRILNDYLAARK